jgi:hypothetical protein
MPKIKLTLTAADAHQPVKDAPPAPLLSMLREAVAEARR